MTENELFISVFDKSIEVDSGWLMDDTRASGYRKCYVPNQAGAKIIVPFFGCAISLLRGSLWQALPIEVGVDYDLPIHPNPWRPVGSIAGEALTIRVDDGVPFQIDLASVSLEIPLVENLQVSEHKLEIVASRAGQTSILGFRVLKANHGSIVGLVNAEKELYLNDLTATIHKDNCFYDKRLIRNPFTNEILLWGLEPGNYDLEMEALGWEKVCVKNIQVKESKITKIENIFLKAVKTIRLPFPKNIKRKDHFRIVKFGHLDTWTQRNAEYLAILADLTNLFDPDVLMIANEANWQYVSGALNRLNMPYLITSGNHGLPGFKDFFGGKIKKVDIGSVTIVVYNAPWLGQVPEIETAFATSPNATFRVLQGVESNIDQDWAKCLKLNLYLCAHAFNKKHVLSSPWKHLGKEFQVVDIDLVTNQIEVIGSPVTGLSSREKYPISREFPFAPVVFSPENNGNHDCVTAHITNPMLNQINDARVVFKMPNGNYQSSIGNLKIIEGDSTDKIVQVEVRLDLPAKNKIELKVAPRKS